ncbi:hypothetical protein CFIO01_09182 [Colletotrichum fioriniae PJ7]|uniref:Uncharacterized protein n=1 Tax=Colletotrichum fioriniae PJ7 TaxID=1445577 RepID=A0A010QZ17_9PEZI|nr:hypothetical protein CFIO01_09182 [Colletotrichum fioriniae PJ7]
MQFQSSLLALASILPLALGAPVGVNTDNLTRSQKALLDSSKLICGQYPGSEWVGIGPLKVPCNSPLLATRDESTDLDTNWTHEYAKKRHEGMEEDGVMVKRDEITDLDTNWTKEYA